MAIKTETRTTVIFLTYSAHKKHMPNGLNQPLAQVCSRKETCAYSPDLIRHPLNDSCGPTQMPQVPLSFSYMV